MANQETFTSVFKGLLWSLGQITTPSKEKEKRGKGVQTGRGWMFITVGQRDG